LASVSPTALLVRLALATGVTMPKTEKAQISWAFQRAREDSNL